MTAAPEHMSARRTADEADWTFGGTWPYEPRWLVTDGLRIHYVDEGPRDGQPVVMLHGNPTWSYLYRNFIPPLVDAGFRAIAHDQAGFGRSHKPKRENEYSIERHVRHFAALVDELALDGVTLVLQDWGGPIGLAWAVEHPERVRRLVILNTWPGGVLPDFPKPPFTFRLMRTPLVGDVLIKGLHLFVRAGMFRGGIVQMDRIGPNERAAYTTPHPSWATRAGVLAYPRLIAWDERHPTYPLGRRNEERLERLADKPTLVCWPLADVGFKRESLAYWRKRLPQAEFHEIADAGHYIQEDAHERIVPLLIDFLKRT